MIRTEEDDTAGGRWARHRDPQERRGRRGGAAPRAAPGPASYKL